MHYHETMRILLSTFIRSMFYLFVGVLLWTCLGQVPVKGKSLESHYHQLVNSQKFQKTFWIVATPITWTHDKVQYLAHQWKHNTTKKSAEKAIKDSLAR